MLATLIEPMAFVLAIAMVMCNIRQWHWGWLFAILSSGLYLWVFGSAKLYGEAALQIVFIALALWGWWQWRGAAPSAQSKHQESIEPRRLQGHGHPYSRKLLFLWVMFWLFLWLILIYVLGSLLTGDKPVIDAFVTAGSVLGIVLLGRKFTANWLVWLVVNIVSTALFLNKGLWLTALLYALLTVMSWLGWRQWLKVAKWV